MGKKSFSTNVFVFKEIGTKSAHAHPAEQIEPPRTRPSPEQPAALGLDLLDLLAQLVLARLRHLRGDLLENALDLLKLQENRTSRSLVHLIPPSVSSTQT